MNTKYVMISQDCRTGFFRFGWNSRSQDVDLIKGRNSPELYARLSNSLVVSLMSVNYF